MTMPHSRPSTLIGAPNHRAKSPPAADVGGGARGVGVAVQARRPAGLEHSRGHVLPAEFHSAISRRRHGEAGAGPRAHDRGYPVRLVPVHDREVDREQPSDLGGDGAEHLLRRGRLADESRHPTQRGLLRGVGSQLDLGLRIGDRGRYQLGEAGQPRLGVRRQRLLVPGCDADDAPQPPLEADRHSDDGADSPRVCHRGALARGIAVVIDPRRLAGPEHQRVDAEFLLFQPSAASKRMGRTGSGPGSDDGGRAVQVVSAQDREVGLDQPPGLRGDRGEHLLRRPRSADQRRYPAQGGPLLADSTARFGRHEGLPGGSRAASSPAARRWPSCSPRGG
jgi:hypothetical protein